MIMVNNIILFTIGLIKGYYIMYRFPLHLIAAISLDQKLLNINDDKNVINIRWESLMIL